MSNSFRVRRTQSTSQSQSSRVCGVPLPLHSQLQLGSSSACTSSLSSAPTGCRSHTTPHSRFIVIAQHRHAKTDKHRHHQQQTALKLHFSAPQISSSLFVCNRRCDTGESLGPSSGNNKEYPHPHSRARSRSPSVRHRRLSTSNHHLTNNQNHNHSNPLTSSIIPISSNQHQHQVQCVLSDGDYTPELVLATVVVLTAV
jgi:hypothetical protein